MNKEQACYHCGEMVPTNSRFLVEILGSSRAMCCPGCEAVAQTIVSSGLTSYYQFRTQPAERADLVPNSLSHLQHYDDIQIQSEFVSSQDGLDSITLAIEGISCPACAWLIEKRLATLKGLKWVRVNTTTSRALIRWHTEEIKLSEILETIHRLGYTAAPFEPDQQEQAYQKEAKRYLYRLGIAGIASMQVMMLAVALYFEVFGGLEPEMKSYLRWVSLIFATPVLVYSAFPFYHNAWRNLKGKTLGMDIPISLALILAYLASAYATIQETGEVFFESIAMFTFFLLLGRFLEVRARRTASIVTANLIKLVPTVAKKTSGESVAVSKLKVGDTITVLPGERIPSDGDLLSPLAYIDESMLTGESRPVKKTQSDQVYAGTLNGNEALTICVSQEKNNSAVSHIVRLQEEAQLTKPKIAQLADTIARYFVAALIVIALGTWYYWHQHNPEQALWVVLSVLVATCPCALSLATPTALTCATSQLAKFGLLLRRSHSLETLCKVNQLVIDKTGTLTTGKITLTNVECFAPFTLKECVSISTVLESHANHPLSGAFQRYYDSFDEKHSFGLEEITKVTNHIGQGLSGDVRGQHVRLGCAGFVLSEHRTNRTNDRNSCYLSIDGRHAATFTYQDSIRDTAEALIQQYKKEGIQTTLLTGDNKQNAQDVASQVGITHIIASASPEDKLNAVNQLAEDKITLMVGDGINDVPTLAGAHLSVAMGGGTDVAQATADIILLGDQLDKLLFARRLALKTRHIIRQNLLWSLGYNVCVLPLAISGMIAPYFAVIGMSASSLIVVTNSLRLLTAPKTSKPMTQKEERS